MIKVESQTDLVAAYEAKGERIPPFIVMCPSFALRDETYYVLGYDTDAELELIRALWKIIKLVDTMGGDPEETVRTAMEAMGL